jgi:hypothetical protein
VPLLVRIYFLTRSWFEKTLAMAWGGAWACFTGLWLGVLPRDSLHAIDEEYYSRSNRGDSARTRLPVRPDEPDYHGEEWNKSGLFDWEKEVVIEYFANYKRLLVIGAGGGREVLALLRLGYEVDGFESHPGLVTAANDLLRAEGYDSTVRLAPRDEAPSTGATYDGIVVGWAMYMLVQGSERRIALLRQLRAQTRTRGPILISFFYRAASPKVYKLAALVANVTQRVLRRQPTEVGDWLQPNYVHFFTQEEVISELSEGGFNSVHYSIEGYGHAVGTAV